MLAILNCVRSIFIKIDAAKVFLCEKDHVADLILCDRDHNAAFFCDFHVTGLTLRGMARTRSFGIVTGSCATAVSPVGTIIKYKENLLCGY